MPEKSMNESQKVQKKDPYAFPGPDDPPRDWDREEAAYVRERDRLVRDHLGEFIVVHQDELYGPFKNFDDAIMKGYARFGDAPFILKEIQPEEPPPFVGIVDVKHPSIKLLDR
jgi:hypothetical protein